MGEALFLIALVGIGVAIGYNIALTEGGSFRQRVMNFFGLGPRKSG